MMGLAVGTFTPTRRRSTDSVSVLRLTPKHQSCHSEGPQDTVGSYRVTAATLLPAGPLVKEKGKVPPHCPLRSCSVSIWNTGSPLWSHLSTEVADPALPQAIPRKNGKKIASWDGDAVFLCSYFQFMNLGMPGGSMDV